MKKSNPEDFFLSDPIVLVGMMGAGKTSVGRALAEILSIPFFDSDNEIEAAAGRPTRDIFTDYGEAEFRRLERDVIARLLLNGPCVLSLGGGAFIDPKTRQRVKDGAFSVWLKVSFDVLMERVLRNADRPLLRGGDPKEKMQTLLAAREPIYAEADVTVLCDDRPVYQTAKHVADIMQSNT